MQVSLTKLAETEAQAEVMLNFLESHPCMVFEKVGSAAYPAELWNDLAELLNPLGPPTRSGQQWNRAWDVLIYNIRVRTRKMLLRGSRFMHSNERGPFMSTVEGRIIGLMKQERANVQTTESEATCGAVPVTALQAASNEAPTAIFSSFPMVRLLVNIDETELDLMDVPKGEEPPYLFSSSTDPSKREPIRYHLRNKMPFRSHNRGTKLKVAARRYMLSSIDTARHQRDTTKRRNHEQRFHDMVITIRILNRDFKRWSAMYPMKLMMGGMIKYTAHMKIIEYKKTIKKTNCRLLQKARYKRPCGH